MACQLNYKAPISAVRHRNNRWLRKGRIGYSRRLHRPCVDGHSGHGCMLQDRCRWCRTSTPQLSRNMRRYCLSSCMQPSEDHTRIASWEVLARPNAKFAISGKALWKRHTFGVANSWLDLIALDCTLLNSKASGSKGYSGTLRASGNYVALHCPWAPKHTGSPVRHLLTRPSNLLGVKAPKVALNTA
jgi:hypothetical protein